MTDEKLAWRGGAGVVTNCITKIIFIYTLKDNTQMAKFLDAHALKGTEEKH
jgi:hypothetical protein